MSSCYKSYSITNDVMATASEEYPAEPVNILSREMRLLKQGVWIYFLLLVFEGALRKWILPGLATPLLVIRDPIAIWLIIKSLKRGLLTVNFYLFMMVLIGLVGLFTALFFGHGNFLVAAFGARILLIHFPLIFVIGKIFTRADVIKMGKACLWISIPMTVLLALQFYSPQTAWVNRGIGGDMTGAGFSGALGFYRPSATFSFTNGTSLFYGFCAPFIVYFWLEKGINKIILIGAAISLLAAIPLSISRGLFFSVTVTMIFASIIILRKPKYIGRMIFIGMGIMIAMMFLSKASFFQTATQAFSNRFETANEQEGGVKGVLVDRYLGGMAGVLTQSAELPFFGYGLGMGTNVGGMLLSGKREFLISEGEWGRVIGEMGTIMGLMIIFLRLALSIKISIACYKKLMMGDLLPWILLSFGLLNLPQGSWSQPTSLGFCVLTGGLIIAALQEVPEQQEDLTEQNEYSFI
ncbi:MAG TPA: hypothetical protein VKC90_08720 [Chitinophagaceae bacterium]|nr:hypothetical protein [Chitinophagaceae bacterium]